MAEQTAAPAANSTTDLPDLLARQRQALGAAGAPDLAQRIDTLDRLIDVNNRHEEALIAAIAADFGQRSRFETLAAESIAVANSAKYMKRHLKKWLRPRKVATPLTMKPGYARLIPQPLGVVGIIGPWNYPYLLSMGPLIAALCAGNRVLLKPSEVTPRTSALIAEIVAEIFVPEEVSVIQGDAVVGAAFAALPLDHLFFTGSPAVGQKVALAAARNLTPVTLELGGKSPCIIDPDGGMSDSLANLIFGKCFNAGQTCIAPDYVLCPADQVESLVDFARGTAGRFFPTIGDNDDVTGIVNQHHYERLQSLLQDARDKGAMVLEINPAQETELARTRKIPLTLVLNTNDHMRIMSEEIFGPLLPIVPYRGIDEAINYVNQRPHPLALYWFGNNRAHRDRVLRETLSGGVTINDTLWQFSHQNLPFGGVGPSGMGAYHGEAGFRTFSFDKPVFYKPPGKTSARVHPPFTQKTMKLLNLLRRYG